MLSQIATTEKLSFLYVLYLIYTSGAGKFRRLNDDIVKCVVCVCGNVDKKLIYNIFIQIPFLTFQGCNIPYRYNAWQQSFLIFAAELLLYIIWSIEMDSIIII